ncbi:MAG TPA: hypothetical protein VNO32_10290 [Candidatus Acidoferrum sp.]|jgi:hypothetical protein|nr:hypothetical protein [Candidatus Acidoferrum sp.]
MKALGRKETAMQIDQAIETRRAARSIADGEPELNLKSPNSLSISARVSRSRANVLTEQSDYSRLEVLTVWVLIVVLAVLSCGAFYVLWAKAGGDW